MLWPELDGDESRCKEVEPRHVYIGNQIIQQTANWKNMAPHWQSQRPTHSHSFWWFVKFHCFYDAALVNTMMECTLYLHAKQLWHTTLALYNSVNPHEGKLLVLNKTQ